MMSWTRIYGGKQNAVYNDRLAGNLDFEQARKSGVENARGEKGG